MRLTRARPRRERYRLAVERARRPPVEKADLDPFEGLGLEELRIFVEAAEEVMAAGAGRPAPGTADRWARPIRRELRGLADGVNEAIDRLERQVTRSVWFRKAGPESFKVPDGVWSKFERDMTDVLSQLYDDVGRDAFANVSKDVGFKVDYGIRDTFAPTEDLIGKQVTRITESSRQELDGIIRTATDRGYSIEQTVRGVPKDGFSGLRATVDRWQAVAPVRTTTDRATLISLTETANAYNHGSLDGYRASTLVEEVNVYDGPSCGWTSHNDPDLAHGSRRTLDEAKAHVISHPHCQRAFGPVVAGAPPFGEPGAQSVRQPSTYPKPPASELELRARAIQARTFSLAGQAEPEVSALMRTIESGTGGRLDGFNHRLKVNGERTVEKITGDVLAGESLEAAGKVRDALRYTLVYDERRYWKGIEQTAEALKRAGFKPIKYKSNWTNPLSHDVNSAWLGPNGTRFELQFHTPTSLGRKMVGGPGGQRASHAIYEELRSLPPGDPRIPALEAELKALWADVRQPSGQPFVLNVFDDALPSAPQTRAATLARVEEGIRAQTTHETLYAVDDVGEVILEKSDPSQLAAIEFTDAEVARMKGLTLTHNHPRAWTEDLDYASSLSPDDVRLMIAGEAVEVRAVGKGANYRMTIDPSIRALVDPLRIRADAEVHEEMTDLIAETLADLQARYRAGKITFDQVNEGHRKVLRYANQNHLHEVWTRVAARLPGGMMYERELL